MPSRYDAAYLAVAAVAGPVVAVLPKLRRKVGQALKQRDGRTPARPDPSRPCVLIHGVSVGEVNAARSLVDALRNRDPGLQVAVASTTETGFARATQLYGVDASADVFAVRWPVDFSKPIRRLLDAVRPTLAVMMELEVWPNFVLHCRRRGIPCAVANGRITDHSFRGYRKVGGLLRPTFSSLSLVLAQEQTYADRFAALGVPLDRVRVVPSLKFDSADISDRVDGDAQLAEALGLNPRAFGGNDVVLVAGSTGPGEEAILLRVYESLRRTHPQLRMVVVPRKPDRFEEVAGLLKTVGPIARRSTGERGGDLALIDTLGELRAAYAMADAVFVGRTLVDLGEKQHGSDMIEPAALAKPVVVGPFWGNFAEPMRVLKTGNGVVEVADESSLLAQLEEWLTDQSEAAALGRRGQAVVAANRGAAARTAADLLAL